MQPPGFLIGFLGYLFCKMSSIRITKVLHESFLLEYEPPSLILNGEQLLLLPHSNPTPAFHILILLEAVLASAIMYNFPFSGFLTEQRVRVGLHHENK